MALTHLTYPEKREFFLEGQGIFEIGLGGGSGGFGAGRSGGLGGSGDAPTIFYSRHIGVSEARAVPIIAGGCLSWKAGRWNVGAFNVETGADVAAQPLI